MSKPKADSDLLRDVHGFQLSLRDWFIKDGQLHPWRETKDPWAILVSEIMLQQTTVGAVRAGRRFEKFLEEFATIEEMAKAPEQQILKAWEGLGYYNRVRNLQKTALSVLNEWDGRFPRTAAELETLPGVGPYTAGAIASFAFNEPAPIVDGNVARVLARVFDDETEIDSTKGKRQLWKWAEELLDRENPRIFNSALMEVGQVFCRPRKPDCLACPIAEFCQARDPEKLPRKKQKAKIVEVTEHALVVKKAGKILLAKEQGSRRKGFYRLPLRSAEEVADLTPLQTSKYAITKHRVTLHLYEPTNHDLEMIQEGEDWFSLKNLAGLPIQSPVRKALESLLTLEG